MIKLIFSRPKKVTVTSQGIMTVLGTNYSHVCIEFELTKFNRKIIFEASHGYVRAVDGENWIKYNYIVDNVILDFNPKQILDLYKYVIPQLGKKYGYMTIIGILFPCFKLGKDGDKTFICSEFIAKCLQIAYNFNMGKEADYITPKDVREIIAKLENEKRK